MPHKIERLSSVTSTISVTASASTSQRVPFGAAAGGVFVVDALAGGASTLSWYVAFGPEDTPAQLSDGTSNVTTVVSSGKCYPVPDAAFAAPFIVAVADSGTASIRLCVKG